MSPRKSEGCFVVRNNGRLEYRFFYIDEYGQKKRTLILTNYNLQMCKNIIRFFYNDKVEQRFPKATIICGKEVRKCLSN